MPAKKPKILITRDETLADRQARIDGESAMTPQRALQKSAPAALKEHKVAALEWERLMRLYNELDGTIVTRLDMGMLLDYCMLVEQLDELDTLRMTAISNWRLAQAMLDAVRNRLEKDGEEIDVKAFAKAMDTVNWAYEKIIKLDGRADRKRSLIFQLRQSLYLTPRSRAGVAPPEKPPEEPDDPMSALLNRKDA